jgi:rubrerythrin
MAITDFVPALTADDEGPVHECRDCGTTLSDPDESCPYCGPTDVVTFDCSD